MTTTLYKSPNPRFDHALVKLLLILLLIAYALMFGGCMSEKKAINYLDNKGALAGICETRYPLKIDTLTLRDTLTQVDTAAVYIATDPSKVTGRDSVTITVTKHVTKTITNTVTKEDVARVAALQQVIKAQQDTIAKWQYAGNMAIGVVLEYKHQTERQRKHIWCLTGLIALLVAIIFRRPIWKLIVSLVNPLAAIIK